jgi:hypothetical protein
MEWRMAAAQPAPVLFGRQIPPRPCCRTQIYLAKIRPFPARAQAESSGPVRHSKTEIVFSPGRHRAEAPTMRLFRNFRPVPGRRSPEPQRERERPTLTEANKGHDLSLGRAGADASGVRLGIRWFLAWPVP